MPWVWHINALRSRGLAPFYFAGLVALAGWALLPEAGPADRRDLSATHLPDIDIPAPPAPSTPTRVAGNARSRLACAECGVIDSVRRIDTRDDRTGSCTVPGTVASRIAGNPVDAAGRLNPAALAGMDAGDRFGDWRADIVRMTTRHEIVVRLRDGSTQVFIERTPRSLHVGDRIQVIAGATETDG